MRKFLDRINVPTFAVCGTLLGICRDNALIPWDNDIDMAILAKDHPNLDLTPFTATRTFSDDKCGHEYTFSINNVLIDLFVVFRKPDHSWFRVGHKHRYIYPRITTFEQRQFADRIVSIPSNWEDCLKTNYGDEWYVPKKSWTWSRAPCCKPNLPSPL